MAQKQFQPITPAEETVECENFNVIEKCIKDNNVVHLTAVLKENVTIYGCMATTLLEMAIDGRRFDILNILLRNIPIEHFFFMLCYDNNSDHLNLLYQNVPDFKQIIGQVYLPMELCDAGFCRYLLRKGANINVVRTTDGYTCLHSACLYEHIENVKVFCGHGAIDINKQNFLMESALHLVCKNNCALEIVKILLDVASIDVNLVDAAGETAFSYACANSAHDIVDYMLDRKSELHLNVDVGNPNIGKYSFDHPELWQAAKKRKI